MSAMPREVALFKHLTNSISCHAWNGDMSLLAFCPNNSELHIVRYEELTRNEDCTPLHVLKKHDDVISDVSWAADSNRIVTCSHDRNAYVWTWQLASAEWNPSLVILRINRAALCVQWSPHENKFAVGSAAKSVNVCYFDAENDWWVSKVIKKQHESSVTAVAWHPNNIFLATASTDGSCHVFAAGVKGVDSKGAMGSVLPDAKFGSLIYSLTVGPSWGLGVAWSPTASSLMCTYQNSTVQFVASQGTPDSWTNQRISLRGLPLSKVAFLSATSAIGVGYDSLPTIFKYDPHSSSWKTVSFLEASPLAHKVQREASPRPFDSLVKLRSISSPVGERQVAPIGGYNGPFTCLSRGSKDESRFQFVTTGVDGWLVKWDVSEILLNEGMASVAL